MRADLSKVSSAGLVTPRLGIGKDMIDDEDRLLLMPMAEECNMSIGIKNHWRHPVAVPLRRRSGKPA
jgi:hypothetical protein